MSSVELVRGDITREVVDAIVNAANERMLGGGGVDGAIHAAAGPELLDACRKVPEVAPGVRCPVGHARITPGFRLAARHVIHTVGPIYDSHPEPARALASAFRSSLSIAVENQLRSIAFPAISCGIYGYPIEEAAEIASQVVGERKWRLDRIRFVLFSQSDFEVWNGIFGPAS